MYRGRFFTTFPYSPGGRTDRRLAAGAHGMSTHEDDLPRQRFAQYLLVAGGLGVAMVLGLLVQALLAYYFGAGAETDALFMARDITEVLTKLLLPSQTVGILMPCSSRCARSADARRGTSFPPS